MTYKTFNPGDVVKRTEYGVMWDSRCKTFCKPRNGAYTVVAQIGMSLFLRGFAGRWNCDFFKLARPLSLNEDDYL